MSSHAAQLLRVLSGDIVAAKGLSWLQIASYHDDEVKESLGAYIVPSLLHALPKQKLNINRWSHLKRLKLADPKFNVPDRVDMLLGADFYSRVIENGVRKKRGAPTAQNTSFGWIVFGGYSEAVGHASIVNTTQSGVANDELMEMLQKFWEFEQVPDKRYRTQEEQRCEDIFTQNIAINAEERYIARMPLQQNAPAITGTYDLAYARVLQMEKRFAKDSKLKENYINFMREYASLGHMILVPDNECKSDKAVYIPHHAAGTAAAQTLRKSFYVDDMLGGSHDESSAIKLYEDLTAMLGKRKLELAKWSSNSKAVLESVKANGDSLIELNKDEPNAVLGMHWSPTEDTFQYKIKNPMQVQQATKRTIVSDIARLYDPCGYLAGVIVIAKVLIQNLWRSKIDWDDEVTGTHLETWSKLCNELPKITKVRIPRWIGTVRNSKKELHGFADASSYAYRANFYLRQEDENGAVTVNLVFAKSRVAVVKGSTIPKLELSGCHLLAKLLDEVRHAHEVNIEDCTLWSDSMIALHWIGKSPINLDTFVGNRVGEIQDLTKGIEWRHVDTKDNPADIVEEYVQASRGICASKLCECTLWWNGPDWLKQPKESCQTAS